MGICIAETNVNLISGQYDECCLPLLIDGISQGIYLIKCRRDRSRKLSVTLVDDGGLLTRAWCDYVTSRDITIDEKVVSIQQTRSGMYSEIIGATDGVVKIDMGRCYAKRAFEPEVIAESIIRKVESMRLFAAKPRVGVVGVGAIGATLALALKNKGLDVYLFDSAGIKEPVPGAHVCRSSNQCLEYSDLIFGCVGRPWIDETSLLNSSGELISCSSRDAEYNPILQKCTKTAGHHINPFSDISIEAGGGWVIRNGGFPINFDREHEWEDLEGITLTRALLVASVVLASSTNFESGSDVVSIPFDLQKEIVSRWINLVRVNSKEKFLSRYQQQRNLRPLP